MKLVLHVIAIFAAVNLPAAASLWTQAPVPKGQFEELTLEFSDAVSTPNNCSGYLDKVEQTLRKVAEAMFNDADRRFLLQNVTIAVPSNWDTSECGNRTFVPSVPKKPDVRIGPIHPVYKNTPWTQQSKACGAPGDYISLSDAYFTDSNYTEDERARLLFRKWMRYRLGVYDDTSCKLLTGSTAAEVCGISDKKWYEDNVISSKKHRAICQNNPFAMLQRVQKDKFKNYVEPTFSYKKPKEPKLVIAFDSTMPQDEWSMTRAAFRSMLDYLTSDLELGLFGYYGKRSIQVYQDITLVTPNRDGFQNLTNKIDVQPKNFIRSNITAALEQAVKMLQANESSAAGHSVFVIATKASMNETELARATRFAEMAKIRVSVIGVGLEQDDFYNFTLLTEKTDGQFHNATIHKIEDTAMNRTYTNISLLIDIEDGLVSALRAHEKKVGNNLLYSTKLTTSNSGNWRVYMEMYSPKSVFRIYVQTFDKKELAKSLLLKPTVTNCNVQPYRKDVYEATPEIWIHSYPARNETCFPNDTKWFFTVDRSQTELPAYARGITKSADSQFSLKVDTWFEPNVTKIVVLATLQWGDMPVHEAAVTAVIVPVDSAYPPQEIDLFDDGRVEFDKVNAHFKDKADIMKGDGVYTALSSYSCGPALVFVTAEIKRTSYAISKNYSGSASSWESVANNINENDKRKRVSTNTAPFILKTTRTVNPTHGKALVCEEKKIERTTKAPTEPMYDPEEETIAETEPTVSSTLSISSTLTTVPSTSTLTEVTSTTTPTVSSTGKPLLTRKTTTSTVAPSSTSTISSTTSTQMATRSTTAITPIPSTVPSTVPSTSSTTQMATQSTTISTLITSTVPSTPSTTSTTTQRTTQSTTTARTTISSTSPSTTSSNTKTVSSSITSTVPSTVEVTSQPTTKTTTISTTPNIPTTLSTAVPSTTLSSTQTMETTTESSTMEPTETTVPPSSSISEETSTKPTFATLTEASHAESSTSIVASTDVETMEHASTELGTTSLAEITSKVNIGKKPKYSGLTRSTGVTPTSTVPTTSSDKAKSSSGTTTAISLFTFICIVFLALGVNY